MLAHQVVEVAVVALGDVSVGARVAHGTVALEVGLTYRARVRDAESLRGEQERAERERIVRVLVFDDLLGELVRARVWWKGLCLHVEASGRVYNVVATAVVDISRSVWEVERRGDVDVASLTNFCGTSVRMARYGFGPMRNYPDIVP